MLTIDIPDLLVEIDTPKVAPGTFSPVTVRMNDTLGLIFIALLTGLVMAQWRRSEKLLHALIERMPAGPGTS